MLQIPSLIGLILFPAAMLGLLLSGRLTGKSAIYGFVIGIALTFTSAIVLVIAVIWSDVEHFGRGSTVNPRFPFVAIGPRSEDCGESQAASNTIIEGRYEKYCDHRYPLASESAIENFERRLGVPLPPHYRDYLLTFNGGYFNDPIVGDEDSDWPSFSVSTLYGLGSEGKGADLARPANLNLFTNNDPFQILPIGCTPGGFLILLVTDPDGDDYGDILLKTFDETYFVANSMHEFFEQMRGPYELQE
jgi:hypothetical protein